MYTFYIWYKFAYKKNPPRKKSSENILEFNGSGKMMLNPMAVGYKAHAPVRSH